MLVLWVTKGEEAFNYGQFCISEDVLESQMSGQTKGLQVLRIVHSQKAKHIIKFLITAHILITLSDNIFAAFVDVPFFSFLHN